MAHIFRFFGRPQDNGLWLLDSQEIEHAQRVLKVKVGDSIEVIDGQGTVAKGTVLRATRDAVEVTPENVSVQQKSAIKRALAFGALKPGDVDELLTQLIELAMDEIHIFQQEDTAKFRTGDKPRERWERLIRAATKQSKRAFLPKIFVHEDFASALLKLKDSYETKLVLDPEAEVSLLHAVKTPQTSIVALVGGERGLSTNELNKCQNNGFMPVKMGPYILRATTAITAAAGVLAMTEASLKTL